MTGRFVKTEVTLCQKQIPFYIRRNITSGTSWFYRIYSEILIWVTSRILDLEIFVSLPIHVLLSCYRSNCLPDISLTAKGDQPHTFPWSVCPWMYTTFLFSEQQTYYLLLKRYFIALKWIRGS